MHLFRLTVDFFFFFIKISLMKDCMVHVVHVPSFNRVERFILRVLLTVEDQGGVFPSVSIVHQVESAYSVV